MKIRYPTLRLRIRDVLLSVASAGLLLLIFPKFGISWLAWVALVPLLIALDGKSLKQAFLLSWVYAAVFFTGAFNWIWAVAAFNVLDYALLGAYVFTVYGGGFGLAYVWVRRRTGLSAAIIAPPLWVTLEFVRAHAGFLSAPWFLLGQSQYLNLPLIQLASVTGVYGLSFLIVFVNAVLAETLVYVARRKSDLKLAGVPQPFSAVPLIAAGLLVLGVYAYGRLVLSEGVSGETMPVALVQADIPWGQKWDGRYRQANLERHISLTRLAATHSPKLIVWPEAAVAADLEHDPLMQKLLGDLAVETRSYLLLGSSEYAKFTRATLRGKYFNSMVLFSPEGEILGQYRKIHLVPFGEYEPLQGVITWPKTIVSAATKLAPGKEFTVFRADRIAFGATICWESHFPGLFREFARQGIQFMVNATNENWFAGTVVPDHFLIATVFRSVENRVAIARSANMGISAIIDPFGRITPHSRNADQPDGIRIGDILLSKERSFYTRYGDVFAFIQIAFCILMLLQAGAQGRISVLASKRDHILEERT